MHKQRTLTEAFMAENDRAPERGDRLMYDQQVWGFYEWPSEFKGAFPLADAITVTEAEWAPVPTIEET